MKVDRYLGDLSRDPVQSVSLQARPALLKAAANGQVGRIKQASDEQLQVQLLTSTSITLTNALEIKLRRANIKIIQISKLAFHLMQ